MVTTKNSAKKLDKSRQTKYTNSKFHPRVQGYSKVLKAKSIIEEMILGVLNYQNTFSTWPIFENVWGDYETFLKLCENDFGGTQLHYHCKNPRMRDRQIQTNKHGQTPSGLKPKLQNPKSKPAKSKIQNPKFQTPKSKLKKKYPESKLPNNEWTFLCAYPRNISSAWTHPKSNGRKMKKASQLFSNIQLGWRNCPVATPQNHFLAQIGEMKADHLNLWKQKLPFLKMKWPKWFWK